jgi:dTDP-4-amino-4,6-dideoxygalactose transaminase
MTSDTVEACINSNTALILGVHPIVNCADVGELTDIAEKHGIPILFDSVESVYESTAIGKVGAQASAECFSLHACKLFNGFGGGYLTTNNAELANKLSSMRSFGFTDVDTITLEDGMNAKLNEMHAAMTLASLDDIEQQINLNRERYYTYKTNMESLKGVKLLEFDEDFRTGYKNIVVEITEDWPLNRENTIKVLNADNVLARPYYYPALHQKEMRYPHVVTDLPITDQLSTRFMNLPCGQLVTNEDIRQIVQILEFLASNAATINQELEKLEEDE